MVAIGIDVHGKEIDFKRIIYEDLWCLWCQERELVSLTIPEGVTHVYCYDNQLTELKLPEGVTHITCYDNSITHLDLPDSVRALSADKEVIGFEKCIGTKTEIRLR